jgi:hypothetical protein
VAEMTNAELLAEIARLQAANAKLATKRNFTLKVGAKGGVSVYGLSRFPVTLYKGQWETLIKHIDEVKSFLVAHDAELSVKE